VAGLARPAGGPWDLAIVTTKSHHTLSAAESLRGAIGPGTPVLSLQKRRGERRPHRRRLERDAPCGFLAREAARLGVPTPVDATLDALLALQEDRKHRR
jgi:ketopantoate reductase